MDCMLVANEVLEEVKRRKRSCIFFPKLTMRKRMTQLTGISFIYATKAWLLRTLD